MSLKTVAVFALDVNCSSASLALAAEVCRRAVETAMLLAPSDEVGLVISGSGDSFNPLHHSSGGGTRFANISVPCDIAAPTIDFFDHLKRSIVQPNGWHGVDFLDTLIVCDHLMHERTRKKRCQRIVYLLTDARIEVVHKEDMDAVLRSCLEHGISLVVVGIDFSTPLEDAGRADGVWGNGEEDEERLKHLADLPVKVQNEQVLHMMCAALGGGSMVLSLEEALQDVAKPRRRVISPRPVKVVLSIGDVRLATQLLTKTRVEQLSTLLQSTTAERRSSATEAKNTDNPLDDDGGGDGDDDDNSAKNKSGKNVEAAAAEPLRRKELIRGYRLGDSLIPCAASMKMIGPKALDAIAVVPLQQVPVYVLMGDGAKVITPLSDDMLGARAFRSIVRAMAAEKKAMIVRFVRTADADPLLGICVPSSNEWRDVFFFSHLPFSDDVRHLQFPGYQEICHCDDDKNKNEEEGLVESIVEEMTVCKSVLQPCSTFNPVIQSYYAMLRCRLHRQADMEERCRSSKHCEGEEGDEGEEECGDAVLSLLDHLRGSFTASSTLGDQHDPFASVREKLEVCSDVFAYVSSDRANLSTATRSPSTAAATTAAIGGRLESVSSVATTAAPFLNSTMSHVTMFDPVKSVCEMEKSEDVPRAQHAVVDDLVDVIFKLCSGKMKDGRHDVRGGEYVSVLRQHCVAEGIPDFFNSFAMRLQLVSLESGQEIPAHFDVHPITPQECASSVPESRQFTHLPLAQEFGTAFPQPGGGVEEDLRNTLH